MILPNRGWSINYTKENLLKEIDDEIQKEYQILNKFSSEKFSIILIVFGVLTIFLMIWPIIAPNFCYFPFLLFYLIAANILILFWNYAESVKKILKKIFKIPDEQSLQMTINSTEISIFHIFNANEREQLQILLNTDWQIAKKGEPHFRAFSLFLISLVGISYANIQGWIRIPHFNDSIFMGVTYSIGVIIYSSIIIFAILNPNIMTSFWELLFDLFKKINESNKSRQWILSRGIFLILLGVLFIVFWNFFFYIFPVILLLGFIGQNIPILLQNFVNNFIILCLLIIILNILIEFIALIFGINLVETIKNEKIWWLEKIKLDILSEIPSNESIQLEQFYKKFEFSDLYIPIPIQHILTFQKYVLFPRWIVKNGIDIQNCSDMDFTILKERFNSQKNLIYNTKPF